MTEINHAKWTLVNMCTSLENLMKIKWHWLHGDSCTHNSVGKS